MLAETVDAVIGIDTHRDSHEVEIADPAGKPITTMQIGNDSAGFTRLLAVIAEVVPGPRVAVCIEGSRSYGIGLARALAAAGLLVLECEQPSHRQRRGKGKSDPIDAHLAVLAALRLDAGKLPVPRADGDREALRILLVARQEITVARTAQIGRLRALLLAGDDTDRRTARTALTQAALATLAGRELRAGARHEQAVRHAEIRRLALAVGQARQQLRDNRAQLLDIVEDIAPGLTSRFGVGPVSAAQAIVSFSHRVAGLRRLFAGDWLGDAGTHARAVDDAVPAGRQVLDDTADGGGHLPETQSDVPRRHTVSVRVPQAASNLNCMDQALWAEELAHKLLEIPLPRRCAHVQGVAVRARTLAPILGDDADLLEAAAWLHDIGYSPDLADTGFHPLDGARYLRDVHAADSALCRLVANHSCAVIEAEERGLDRELSAEFPAPDSGLSDALTYCDMTTNPTGCSVSVRDRLSEIRQRYGPSDVVTSFVQTAESGLLASVARVSSRLIVHHSEFWRQTP